MLVGAGVLGWAGLPLVGHPEWDIPALGAGLALGGASYVSGRRSWRNNRTRDLLASSLAPLIGGPDRKMVTLTNDERVRISYVAHQKDWTDEWQAKISAIVTMRMGEPYYIESIDGPRRRVVLAPARLAPLEAADERSTEHARFEDAVLKLVGETGRSVGSEFDDDGRLTALELRHGDPVRIAHPAVRRNIERLIAAIQAERWRARWDLTDDWVRFERRPAMPTSVWLPTDLPDQDGEDLLANYGSVRIPIGVDEDGTRVEWVPAVLPQMLITGGTGSGKTSTMHGLLAEITGRGREWPVWIADGKQIEFLAFRDWPNVQMVATSIPEQVAMIAAAEKIVNERYALIKKGQAKTSDFEPLVVVIDELAELVQNLLDWYPEVKGKNASKNPPTLKSFASIARLARSARVHLITAMQRPDVALLGGGGKGGGEARSNFGFRLSVGRLDPQGASMMWQNAATGVAIPRGLRQRGMVTGPDGQPIEAQFFRFPDMDAADGTPERELIETFRPKEARHPRLVIDVPAPYVDVDGHEIVPDFHSYADAQWHLASDRPDLDPLRHDPSEEVDGRLASSPATILGVGGARPSRPEAESDAEQSEAPDQRHLHSVTPDSRPVTAGPDPAIEDPDGEFAGYGEEEDVPDPLDLQPGDLIDLGDGAWGVVEDEPVPDPDDESLVLIAWRGNVDDDEGTEAVPLDQPIAARKPLSSDDDEDDVVWLFEEEASSS